MTVESGARILAFIFAGCGLLALWASVTGARWFFESVNVRMLTGRLPRPAARIIYGLLAIAILFMAYTMWHQHP